MKRLLIVDDDEMVLSGLAATMEEGGLKVDTAGSGHAAIERLNREAFDLVLTDLVMEDGDGLLLMRRMAERWPEVPVVVLTGHGTAESAMEAVRHGAADFIQKPARPEEIRERIAGVFAARDLRRRMEDARAQARSQQLSTDARAARRCRMQAIRRVAEGVAEPLAVLLPLLDRQAATAPAAREAGEQLRELLAWIRPDTPSTEGTARLDEQLKAVLTSSAFRKLRDDFAGVQFETRVTEGLPPIRLPAAELRGMLRMLLQGAFQAAGKRGRITVSVGTEEADGPFGHCFEGVSGRHQYLRIQHSGYIPPDDLEHLFEPYYAKKRLGRAAAAPSAMSASMTGCTTRAACWRCAARSGWARN
jgi:FixJ family two-component response regulator